MRTAGRPLRTALGSAILANVALLLGAAVVLWTMLSDDPYVCFVDCNPPRWATIWWALVGIGPLAAALPAWFYLLRGGGGNRWWLYFAVLAAYVVPLTAFASVLFSMQATGR